MATTQIKDLTTDNAPAPSDWLVSQKTSNDATRKLSIGAAVTAYVQNTPGIQANAFLAANAAADGLVFVDILTIYGDGLVLDGDLSIEGNVEINGDLAHDGGDVGFHGAAPTPPAIIPLTSPTVQDVVDALVAKGLAVQQD